MSRIAVALCIVFVASAPLGADEPSENPFGDPSAPTRQVDDPTPELEAKIRQELRKPTKMDFTETPLQDLVQYLKDLHHVEIQLDSKALEDKSIGSDSPITRRLDGVSLASGLKLVLRDLDLTYVVRDGVLLITTQAAARRMLELRVYNVGELVKSEADADRLAGILQTVLSCKAEDAAARPDKAEATRAQAAKAELLRPAIVPFRNVLLVKASQHDHDRIAQLLGDIWDKLQSGP
jgi:hypothetical protein